MRYINQKEFEKLNIIHWHKNGYTGKGIKVANFESANTNLHYLNNVRDPFGICDSNYKNRHGNKTLDVITQVAPDSQFYILPTSLQQNFNGTKGDMVGKTIPFLHQEKIHLINASLIGNQIKKIDDSFRKLQKQGTTFVTSAGNSGDKGMGSYATSGIWISVGAVGLNKDGSIYKKSYSSTGEKLFTTSFSGLNIHDSRKGYEDRTFPEEGTSFSSPLLCGMLALVQQFFLEKIGRALNQSELMNFIKDNSIDLGDEGKDIEYGHGLFVLPNIDTINLKDYIYNDNNKGDVKMEFKDVDKNRWSYKNIKKVTDLGIMNGYPDETFKPNGQVTREELATVIVNLLNKIK